MSDQVKQLIEKFQEDHTPVAYLECGKCGRLDSYVPTYPEGVSADWTKGLSTDEVSEYYHKYIKDDHKRQWQENFYDKGWKKLEKGGSTCSFLCPDCAKGETQ